MILNRLNRMELIELVESLLFQPSTEVEDDQKLLSFAANCPDPVAAMRLLLECDSQSAQEIVDRAMSMSTRNPELLSEQELHPSHPLRHFQFGENGT